MNRNFNCVVILCSVPTPPPLSCCFDGGDTAENVGRRVALPRRAGALDVEVSAVGTGGRRPGGGDPNLLASAWGVSRFPGDASFLVLPLDRE